MRRPPAPHWIEILVVIALLVALCAYISLV